MARKYKMHCERCYGEVDEYEMELMMGRKGFRSYPVHKGKCPPKRAGAKPREMKQLSLTLPSPSGRGKEAGA